MPISRTKVNALVDDDGSGTVGTSWAKARVVDIYDDIDTYASPIGTSSDIAYAGGNFTASGSQTWTVDSGDVGTNIYWRFEKKIVWTLLIDTSSVGGTPSSELWATIPLGLTVARSIIIPFNYIDNGTFGVGEAIATTGQTKMRFLKTSGGTNWTASANNTSIYLPGIEISTTT